MLIDDIEYVIFRHPDLPTIRQFMIDYGLLDAVRQGDSLYLRGYGDAPFAYVTSQGEAAFVGMGFRVASQDALVQLATRFSAQIEDCPHPGGGRGGVCRAQFFGRTHRPHQQAGQDGGPHRRRVPRRREGDGARDAE